ncbi:MAG: UvrD-helicase domain-containing protein [Propionibacteriaceae bacterium]
MNISPIKPFDIANDIETGTVLIEASAGTGKTYTIASLVARYIAEGVPLNSMMIVTFSRMATQELRSRIRERCETVLQGLEAHLANKTDAAITDPVTQFILASSAINVVTAHHNLSDALADYDAATIATTHEFCHRMISSLGSLAPQPGREQFSQDLTELTQEVALDVWLEMFSATSAKRAPITIDEALTITKKALLDIHLQLCSYDKHDVSRQRVQLAKRARELAYERKTRRGITTYDDMVSSLLLALEHPELGHYACQRLSQRFPVVLIDEFQDTDPQQWQIISKAFISQTSQVFLIGDPKQAIYGFRGADIYSYLAAAKATTKYSLATNWRSDDALVTAISNILKPINLGHRDITVTEVAARHKNDRIKVTQARWQPPLRLRILPCQSDGSDSIATIRSLIDADLIDDISGLIASEATINVGSASEPEWRPVSHSDIAILVSTNRAGNRISQALTDAAIPHIFAGSGSVFATEAAHDWVTLLNALIDLQPMLIRQVALTSFHGWDTKELALATAEDLTALGSKVRSWSRILHTYGMATLVTTILESGTLQERILSYSGGERILTDLHHIGENLIKVSYRNTGIRGVLDWLQSQISASSSDIDDVNRRLETDADAVKIMTIHRAKGLEFPIVYLPEASDKWDRSKDTGYPFVVHQTSAIDMDQRILDVGASSATVERKERYLAGLDENRGEDLRTLYVALTRAQSRVTMWWAPSANLGASSLHRTLSAGTKNDINPLASYPITELAELQIPDDIAVQYVQSSATLSPPRTPTPQLGDSVAARAQRQIDQSWRRTSYSALTAAVHGTAPAELIGKESDEPESASPGDLSSSTTKQPSKATPSPMATMAGGTNFGTLVHSILEQLDPMSINLEAELTDLCQEQLRRIMIKDLAPQDLATALLAAVTTPLGPLANGRSLSQIPVNDRLAELDFEIPLGNANHYAFLSDVADIIEKFLPVDDILSTYPKALRMHGLDQQSLHGFMTGSIDALLRVDDRHLVVDYKTNRIAPPTTDLLVEHHTLAAMAETMISSHYPLQALLYSVATHRFLRWRLPNYDPETHLGGILYLFVRGMAGPASAQDDFSYGVFQWKPPAALVVALSDLIGGCQ